VEEDVAFLLNFCESQAPLRGIVHAAGVLEDGPLIQQNVEQLKRVFAAKVRGAWNLHLLTQDKNLDFFVTFSSLAALLETAGAGVYPAANAFLDGLVEFRRTLGLAGLSINWAPWTGVGMSRNDAESFQKIGIEMIPPEDGSRFFTELLPLVRNKYLSSLAVARIDWERLRRTVYSDRSPNLFAHLIPGRQLPQKNAIPSDDNRRLETSFRLQLASAPHPRDVIQDHVLNLLMAVLGTNEQLNPREGFFELGMDSLMALEFRERLEVSIGSPLPSTLVFKYPQPVVLIDYLNELLVTRTDRSTDNGRKSSAQTVGHETQDQNLSIQQVVTLISKKFEEYF
jgi:hypothetical protein